VVSRSGGGDKHADESPSRRRGPRALVSISVSPIGATANNQPSRKVKRDRPRSPCRPATSAARPVVIAEVLEGTTGGPIPAAIVGVSASAAERHGSRIDPGGSALGCGSLAGAEQVRAVAPGPGSALTLHANDIASKVRRLADCKRERLAWRSLRTTSGSGAVSKIRDSTAR